MSSVLVVRGSQGVQGKMGFLYVSVLLYLVNLHFIFIT